MDALCINLQMFNIEAALFDSLRLLGFDENKFQIQLTPGLFSRANYAAGDALFYFIFSKLRPTQYEADFQGLWPNSGKSVAAAFRKICHGFVFELENEGAIAKSNSSRSALANSQGDRFVRVLWQLSAHALAVSCMKLPQPPPLTCAMHQCVKPGCNMADLLLQKLDCVAEARNKLLNTAAAAVHKQKQWQELADEIVEENRALQAKRATMRMRLKELENEAELARERNPTPLSDRVTDAKAAWDSLLNYADECATLSSGPVRDVIGGKAHRYGITEDSLTPARDGCLHGSTSTQRSGERRERAAGAPIDLSEIVRHLAISVQGVRAHLHSLAQIATRDPSHLLREEDNPHITQVQSLLALHKTHLAAGQKLEALLREQIPLVEHSGHSLLHEIEGMEEKEQPEDGGSPSPRGGDRWGVEDVELGLVPPTPEVKLSSVSHLQEPATSPAPCPSAAALPFLTPVKPTREARPRRPWPTLDGTNEDERSMEDRIALLQKDVLREAEYEAFMAMSPLK